jgi:putative membrane protein
LKARLEDETGSKTMTTQTKIPPPTASPRAAIAAILGISVVASLFLLWLIYIHPAADTAGAKLSFLPALNAILNGLSATALLIGYTFIRARRIAAHRAAMFTAFAFSSLFLVSYILHHTLHGDVRYPAHAAYRSPYLALLATHIFLAIVALPMVLTTFFFSLSGRIPMHRKIARWTFPIWLYVSITGVITYVMLRLAQG